jgi:hypothetical protein
LAPAHPLDARGERGGRPRGVCRLAMAAGPVDVRSKLQLLQPLHAAEAVERARR